jgi:uncharacterized repeat protein (TIGR03803 family)
VLYTFTGGTDGGGYPISIDTALIQDDGGNLYGTTIVGGDLSCPASFTQPGCGVVFKLDRRGNESVLYSFTGGADGSNPGAGLLRDRHGNLYGTTSNGGSLGAGAVFKVDRAGNETALYSFTGGTDGGSPYSNLVRDENGNLYGTASDGGSSGRWGVVFKVDQNGNETVLYNFTGGADGGHPLAGLVRDHEGNLYGTTPFGGQGCAPFGCGVVFKLDPNGNETVLYSFTGGADGSHPWTGLTRDEDGNLHGTAGSGGDLTCSLNPHGCGVVYKLDPTGKETVLYAFTGTDGAFPYSVPVRDERGNLYGTTESGGDLSGCGGYGCGVVFKLDRWGNETTLYSFTGLADGAFPQGLLLGKKDTLYGITSLGGSNNQVCQCNSPPGCGVVFQLSACGDQGGEDDCEDNH